MFQEIYPRSLDEHGRSTIGLLEELGEAAEAVRVFEQHPKYFFGEAADIFSYIMGIANEHALSLAKEGEEFSFGEEFLRRYPGLCPQCGSRVCACPSVPQATVGRMAKEIDLKTETIFITDMSAFLDSGKEIGHEVLEKLGGYNGLLDLPFDRGDTNRALVTICLGVARAFDADRPELANSLRSEAFRISANAQELGSVRKDLNVGDLLQKLEGAWRELDSDLRTQLKKDGGLIGDIAEVMDTIQVLFVSCTPIDQEPIRSSGELRAINDSVNRGSSFTRVSVEQLPASTQTDLRRKLLHSKFNIVHFSGHSDENNLIFEDESGNTTNVTLDSIKMLFKSRPVTKCLILNSCKSVKNLKEPIAEITIGLDAEVDHSAAIEFSRGFYDAVAMGKTFTDAFDEGKLAATMSGHSGDLFRLLK